MKKFSTQALDFDRSVCIAATFYVDPIKAVTTNQHFFGKIKTCAKCLFDIAKTVGCVRVCTTDRRP